MSDDPPLPFKARDFPAAAGPSLRAARERAGWTRREVAEAAGMAPRTLARIERAHQVPTWPTLDCLCEVLGVSVATVAPLWLRDSFDVPADPMLAPGLAVRALRVSAGLTLEDLASAAGVSAATLSRHERGLTASRLLAVPVPTGETVDAEAEARSPADRLAVALGFAGASALARAVHAAFAADRDVG